jgi:tRNA(fMet)-specific endonuclease VapC
MKTFMLDTNTISFIIKGNEFVVKRMIAVPMVSICISSITEGELLFGLAKRPDANNLHKAVQELLRRVDVLPWDSHAAQHYGSLRAKLVSIGKTLGSLDLLIAAHAMSVNAVLITNDKAFSQVENLRIEDWSIR